MELHSVRVYPSSATPAKQQQLAWKLAEVATDDVAIDSDVADGSRSVILRQVSYGIAIRMAVMSMAIGSHAAADREAG